MSDDETSLLNISLLIAIAFIAIAAIWITSSTIGPFLGPQYWLLILGIIGILCIRTFKRHRE